VRNADGSYTYAGRVDDMLKVGGIWVSPFEVEATLMQHPSVLEAAVIGAPDADGLVKSKAFVVLKEGAAADEVELQHFVKDRLAPYKYPRSIAFIAELPKTATGKIQRFRLREQEQAAETKGQFIVPDDFDTMGQEEIEKLFYGEESSSLKPS
jgi:benzoate-CoA ligase